MAKPFLDVVALSLIPLVIYQGFKQFADGKSQTKYSMHATLIANLINIIFNYLLIYGVWIFPEMGMMVAAYGTLISRVAILIYFVWVLNRFIIFLPNLIQISVKELNKNTSKYRATNGVSSSIQS